MDEEKRKNLIQEIDKIIENRREFMERNYIEVRDSYQNHYNWPVMDTLRHEICLCLIFGIHQAAITLTNHLLESLLKVALINYDTNSKVNPLASRTQHSIEYFVSKFRPARKKYGASNLGDNINSACTAGLITKDQKKKLHRFRERFRIPYSHSDKDKTFGNQRISAQAVHIENGQIIAEQSKSPKLAELIIAHGLAQAKQAEHDAVPYFLYMDDLVREIRVKLFGPLTGGTDSP